MPTGNDSNVQFLDQTDEDSPNASLFETQAFAFGNAISASIVDSTVSSVNTHSDLHLLELVYSPIILYKFRSMPILT